MTSKSPHAAAHDGDRTDPHHGPGLATTATRAEAGGSGAQLDHKVATARTLLGRLDPRDPRVRLLEVAVETRDETTLDGLVHELRERTHRTFPPIAGVLTPAYDHSDD